MVINLDTDIKIKNNNYNFKMRVSSIIIKNNRLLVDSDNSGFLCLPGGYVELGETTEMAIIRELKEEIGLTFEIDEFLGVAENFFKNKNSKKMHEISFYYLVHTTDLLSDNEFEIQEKEKNGTIVHNFKWIDISLIKKCNLKPIFIKEIVQKENMIFGHVIINN